MIRKIKEFVRRFVLKKMSCTVMKVRRLNKFAREIYKKKRRKKSLNSLLMAWHPSKNCPKRKMFIVLRKTIKSIIKSKGIPKDLII